VDDREAVNLLGVHVSVLSIEALVNFVSRTILARGKARAVYANIYAINLAQELNWFRDFFNRSDVVYCDGFGVKWGARLLRLRIPYRYTPPDWIKLLAAECARQSFSLYLLGARPGVAEKVAGILKQQFPNLMIAGTHHGYFDKSPDNVENEAVLHAINKTSPDILLVGLGMPLQERWLMENWDRFEAKVALPVGALFDYLAGEFPRAPHWMTDHGLEWIGRLIVEPHRLWRRYILGNPHFLWQVLKQRLGLQRVE
jgi:N-acetylglucosaminyldiphosphoundecaprenol N-acetyl-beta-D-mannosaminyltransferase